jgi:hypothetical protein
MKGALVFSCVGKQRHGLVAFEATDTIQRVGMADLSSLCSTVSDGSYNVGVTGTLFRLQITDQEID